MALIYKATLTPTKLELLNAWLPGRTWFRGEPEMQQLGAYRFDDPSGDVGLEALLLRATDGSVLHVPLTYRSALLAGGEKHLVGTTDHSVLGQRWVYDGCSDPVWAAALATTVLTGGTQVEELVDQGDGSLKPRESTATVSGSGTPGPAVAGIGAVTARDEARTTVIRSDSLELVIVRVIGAGVDTPQTLTGRWKDGGTGVLAGVRTI